MGKPLRMNPLLQAIVELRDDPSKTKRDKQLEFHLAFGAYLIAWLDCAPPDAVKASMEYGAYACGQHGQCHCGHHMSEGHVRHGNGWIPPAPTALAQAWTESDQQEAFLNGWLVLVSAKNRPYVAAVPGSLYEGVPDLAACIRERAANGDETARKAVAIIGSVPYPPDAD